MHSRTVHLLSICLLLLVMVSMIGCSPKQDQETNEETIVIEETSAEILKDEDLEDEDLEDEEDNIIVAETVDTSSNFSFSVVEALIGLSYSDEPIVVLVGTFENNSDKSISFSWALEATAVQSGYTLPTAYLSGSRDFNYNDIEPGSTIPIFIGWKIMDSEDDITLTVVDTRHYAKEEIYSQTFTIDELIQNTLYYDDADEVIDEPLPDAFSGEII